MPSLLQSTRYKSEPEFIQPSCLVPHTSCDNMIPTTTDVTNASILFAVELCAPASFGWIIVAKSIAVRGTHAERNKECWNAITFNNARHTRSTNRRTHRAADLPCTTSACNGWVTRPSERYLFVRSIWRRSLGVCPM